MAKSAKVIVEKIYAAREGKNQAFSTLQLRQEREKSASLGNLRNLMLGDSTDKMTQVVAFETMSNANITAFGVVEGGDLSKFLGQDVTLKIEEVTEEEYLELSDRERIGFQFKQNNAVEGKILTVGGKPVFRKVSLDIAGASDRLVSHTAMVEGNTFDIIDYRELSSASSEAEGITG